MPVTGKASGAGGQYVVKGEKVVLEYGNSGASAKAAKAFDSIAGRFDIIRERLIDPQPALNAIVGEFGLMEATRFMNRGAAPEFEIMNEWEPDLDATLKERKNQGGNNDSRPLLNFGYLARAASNPELEYVGTKSVNMIINPQRESTDKKYSKGKNYGAFHQVGMGNNPRRQFVEMTPQFIYFANEILIFYIFKGEDKTLKRGGVEVPSNGKTMGEVKSDLRKFERKFKKKNPELHTFGASHEVHSGRGVAVYDRQISTVGGKTIGKRGY